ncbi:MAG: MATE family efflux transporter [Bulleidia sp.]
MDKKKELFETMPLNKAIIQLVIPNIVGSLVMIIYNLADTFFVGLLNDPVQTSAVTLISVLLLLFNAINNLFGVGTSSLMSRCLGAKREEDARKASATGFYLGVISAICFTILCFVFKTQILHILGADETTFDASYRYMFWAVNVGALPSIMNVVMGYMIKSEGDALRASIGTISGCVLNIILDPFFVLPQFLGMGVEGAGLATFISNCVAFAYFLYLVLIRKRGRTIVSLNPKRITFNSYILGGIAGVGVPASIQNMLNVVGQTILNNFAAAFGATAVAAIGISYRLSNICFGLVMGMSQGVMPLVSYNYASGNISRMKEAVFKTLKLTGGALFAVMIFYVTQSRFLVSLFIENSEVVAIGSVLLRGFALAMPFLGMDFVGVGVFQATGYGRMSLLFAIARKIILEIPFLFILNAVWPLYGLGYAQFCAEFILSIVSLMVLRHLFKGWERRSNPAV